MSKDFIVQAKVIKREPPYVKAGIVTTIVGKDGSIGGKDGSLIYTGSGVPSNTLGVFTDIYIDTDTPNNFYQKDSTDVWVLKGQLKGIQGDDGREVLIRNNGTYIQWKYDGDETWTNIIALSDLKGDTGSNIELQKSLTHIQWRVVGDTDWIDLIAIADLKGSDGYTPVKGVDYFDGRGIVSFDLINTVGKTKTYRLLYTDSTYVDINIVDGNDGVDGITPHIGLNGNWYIGETDTGVKAEGSDGTNGTDGVGISNITKTGTVDNVDEYTITFTNTSTFIFYVTNGLNGSNGNDGNDGRGIVSIIKTSTVGLVDTYTITYTDTTTSTFDVTNGADGKSAYKSYVEAGGTLSENDFNRALSNTPTHISDETIHHTIEELNDVYEPKNSNIQEHIADTNIHIDSSSELGVDINETNHSLLLWNGLKALKVTFARLKTWIGSYFFAIGGNTFGSKKSIGSTDYQDFGIITNNVERVTVLKGGNIGIGTTTPRSKLQVNGGVQCGNDTAAASADKVGTFRYRATANASYVEICVQTGATTYQWQTIITNTW